ncbi:hypothetical protein HNR44_002348 [Geomicrobium halophilum]|uniref:Uncharacterized protein n=1 Tax=Geomicrobium halophilum TaxID=549000 RepID=A0A841Q029_9BACL|nr:DUF6612 family protein [Geomicrobium halophilum]MBB6450365.1 hypothetical protein [Geomicrobium halophilum]
MKFKYCFPLLYVTLLLCACNGQQQPEEEAGNIPADNDNGEQHEEIGDSETEGDPGAEEILERSVEAMSEVYSFALRMETIQEVHFNGGGFRTKTESENEVTTEPFAYYEDTTMVDEDNDEEIHMETYFTEEGFFTHVDEWVKFPADVESDIRGLSEYQQNPEQYLEMLTTQLDTDSLEIEENEDHYTITVRGHDEGMLEVAMSIMENHDNGMGMIIDDIMSVVDVNEVIYEIVIDKETHYYQEFNANVDMNIEVEEGESVTSQQIISTTYESFNEINEITVPEEVIEDAEEINVEQELDPEPGAGAEEE